ncbi:hypothetical protein DFH09DRAFT_1167428 [Mycena vulgaris]|nr:hypothetical protein DFH09DRAFT_1167428 [Mycena vulgaris]
MALRDPHEPIVRNVLIFPADGGNPRISPMTFNEEGARSPGRELHGASRTNPYGFYTVNVDLRSLYGERNMHATGQKGWDITDQPDKITDGQYNLFHNVSPKLPINATMARLVGANAKRPGERPLRRGDVVVVKRREWPAPIAVFSSTLIPFWYKSDEWRDFLRTEKEFNDLNLKGDKNWPMYQKLYPMLGSVKAGLIRRGMVKKTSRMVDRLMATQMKNIERQNLDDIVVCGYCKVNVCEGCRNEKYCSTECQKLAWKEHKSACKATR